jgi:peroxidase family protein
MLNTLANHGFLPHSGKGITEDDTMNALYDALHLNKTLGGSLFDFALTTNPQENATTFDLDHLGRHNVLEHDASLSRVDAHFGNPLIFNQTIFDQTKAFFTGDKVDVTMAAKARLARIKDSMANNPDYSMSDLGTVFSFGESVAYIIALGDLETGTADRDRIEFLFGTFIYPLPNLVDLRTGSHEQHRLVVSWRKRVKLIIEIIQNTRDSLSNSDGRGPRICWVMRICRPSWMLSRTLRPSWMRRRRHRRVRVSTLDGSRRVADSTPA